MEMKAKDQSHVQSNQIKHASHIEIEGLLTLVILKVLKGSTPTSGGVGDEDINADDSLVQFPHFALNIAHEFLDLICVADIGGNGHGTAGDSVDGVEFVSCCSEIRWVPGCDDDQRAPCLE
jgi:hypothetical protein